MEANRTPEDVAADLPAQLEADCEAQHTHIDEFTENVCLLRVSAKALRSTEERADCRVQVANEDAKSRIEKLKPYLQHLPACSKDKRLINPAGVAAYGQACECGYDDLED